MWSTPGYRRSLQSRPLTWWWTTSAGEDAISPWWKWLPVPGKTVDMSTPILADFGYCLQWLCSLLSSCPVIMQHNYILNGLFSSVIMYVSHMHHHLHISDGHTWRRVCAQAWLSWRWTYPLALWSWTIPCARTSRRELSPIWNEQSSTTEKLSSTLTMWVVHLWCRTSL